MIKIIAIAAACCALQVPAADAYVGWHVTGTVSSVSSSKSYVSVGDNLDFYMGMEISHDLAYALPNQGWFVPEAGAGSLSVGSTYAHLVPGSGSFEIGNYPTGDYVRGMISYNVWGSRLIEAKKDYSEAIYINANGPSTVLSSDRLNGETISSDLFPDFSISHMVYHDGQNFQIGYSNLKWSFSPPVGSVPEPSTWMMMMLGFGVVGGAMRRRHSVTAKVRIA